MTTAEKLIKARGNRTREEVANAIGVSISAMAMYETGARVPRDEIKIRLANYYNTTVQYLFLMTMSLMVTIGLGKRSSSTRAEEGDT